MAKRTATKTTRKPRATTSRPKRVENPAWLESLAEGPQPVPPVTPRAQYLPLETYPWSDFERLCRRLAGCGAAVERAWTYGTPGQAQQGIDILVRHSDGARSVWQTKRYRKITAAQADAAVKLFLKHPWADVAARFVLAVSCDLTNTRVVQVLDHARDSLQAQSIAFETLDRSELTERLRAQPELVDDFFGRAWVHAVCPPEALDAIKHRVSHFDRRSLRGHLRQVYEAWALSVDPGLPIGGLTKAEQLMPSVSIEKRYVVPDVAIRRLHREASAEPSSVPPAARDDERRLALPSKAEPALQGVGAQVTTHRVSIDTFVRSNQLAIVEGEAGAGKSTFLRAFALDILADAPRFDAVRTSYADYIPVWISFPLWVRIAEKREVPPSLEEVVREFFRAIADNDIADRVANSLRSPNLILLVDGLDEALNPTAAQSVCTVLSAFVTRHQVPCFITSRAHGLRSTTALAGNWARAEIAPFTPEQRRALVSLWKHVLADLEHDQKVAISTRERRINQQTDAFCMALDSNAGIARLSLNPLLLLVLFDLYRHGQSLPRSRFAAIDRVVQQLDEVRPQQRAAESLMTSHSRSNSRLRTHLLADLAFALHNGELQGTVSDSADTESAIARARRLISARYAHYGADEVDEAATQHLEFSEERAGLLVKKAPGQLGFLHLSIQEFLAARHLLQFNFTEKVEFVRTRACLPRWREPILSLLYLTQSEAEVGQLLQAIERAEPADAAGRGARQSLLIEAIFTDFAHDVDVVRTLAVRAFSEIDNLAPGNQRQALFTQCVYGLTSESVGKLCRQHLRQWLPNRHGYARAGVLRTMPQWPLSLHRDCVNVLIRSLAAEEEVTRVAAAETLPLMERADMPIRDTLLRLAYKPPSIKVLASALRALGTRWFDDSRIGELAKAASRCAEPDVRMEAFRMRCRRGEADESDLRIVLKSIQDRHIGRLPNRDLLEYFAIHQRQSLKDALYEAESALFFDRNPHDLWPLVAALLLCDPEDQVAERGLQELLSEDWMVRQVVAEEGFPTERIVWTEALIDCVERFATGREAPLKDYELYFITKHVQTKTLKQRAIDNLLAPGEFKYWSALTLVENWDVRDADVNASLCEVLDRGSEVVASIANVVPRIVTDREECRALLLRVLAGRPYRVDFIGRGLKLLGISDDDNEVFQALQGSRQALTAPAYQDGWVEAMISIFPNRAEVRRLAREEIMRRDGAVRVVAECYGDDTEMLNALLETLRPLDHSDRTTMVSALKPLAATDQDAFELLKATRDDVHPAVSTQAIIGWTEALIAHGELAEGDLTYLEGELHAIGPHMDSRRQAAVASLTLAESLDRFAVARDRDQPLNVRMSAPSYRGSAEALRVVLTKWSYVRTALGSADEAFQRLHLSDPSLLGVMETNGPARECVDLWFNQSRREITRDAVRALARIDSDSDRLRQLVRTCLRSGNFGAAIAAGDVFAEQFSNDQSLRDEVVGMFRATRSAAATGALAELLSRRPDADLAKELRSAVHNVPQPLIVHFKLLAVLEEPEVLVHHLDALLRRGFKPYEELQTDMWLPIVLRRVSSTADTQQAMYSHVTKEWAQSNLSMVSILAFVTGVTKSVRDLAQLTYDRSVATRPVDIAFDLTKQTYSIVPLALQKFIAG